MSSYNRVIDYMSKASDAVNHREVFKTRFTERAKTSRQVTVDGVECERRMIGPGERNVIREFSMQYKFTQSGFRDKVELSVMSIATKNDSKDQIVREKKHELSFKGNGHWWLLPSLSEVRYSAEGSSSHVMNEVEKREIVARCSNMSASESDQLPMKAISEKLMTPIDMRHLFMKAYLILMDYNLAVTSKCENQERVDDLQLDIRANATAQDRIATVLSYDAVIDADGFTPEELGLIGLAAQEYPSVVYAGQDNIYTQINMLADKLTIISEGPVDIDADFCWGSPDRLYSIIWSVACKLGCVDDLVEAMATMRGKAKMGDDLCRVVDENEIYAMVPTSRNLSRAFSVHQGYNLSNVPGYLSTSMSLVSDLIYGMMYEASATCVVEELGGIGNALSSKTPDTSRTFNGLLRDHGLEYSDIEVNLLLQNWYSLGGSPLIWSFGKMMKQYCIKLAERISNGLDLVLPQAVHLIPYAHTHNTTWGISRGWQGLGDNLGDKKDRKNRRIALASVAWLMGCRTVRPKVGRNTWSTTEIVHQTEEYRLAAECPGGCVVTRVRFTLSQDVGGRVDEHEKVAKVLQQHEYAGTKCSLVYDVSKRMWAVPQDEEFKKTVRETLAGEVPKEEEPSYVRPVTFGGAIPKRADPFIHLKNLVRGDPIKIDREKRHVKVSSGGSAFVAPYTLNGEPASEPRQYRPKDWSTGDVYALDIIKTPERSGNGMYAALEDLKVHGYVAKKEVDKAVRAIEGVHDKELLTKPENVAAIVNELGFGMDVIDEASGSLERFGPKGGHRVTIVKQGSEYHAAAMREEPDPTKGHAIEQVVSTELVGPKVITSVAGIKTLFKI